MAGEQITLNCNRCGECCRGGGRCELRRWIYEKALPVEFEGICDFLTDFGECRVMANVRAAGRWAEFSMFFPNIRGVCDFPHRRVDS